MHILFRPHCYRVVMSAQTAVLTNARRVERKETLMSFLCKTHVCTWDMRRPTADGRGKGMKKSHCVWLFAYFFNFANKFVVVVITHLTGTRSASVKWPSIIKRYVVTALFYRIIIFTIRYLPESFRGFRVFSIRSASVYNFFPLIQRHRPAISDSRAYWW